VWPRSLKELFERANASDGKQGAASAAMILDGAFGHALRQTSNSVLVLMNQLPFSTNFNLT
jgi:hypothetical protein